MTFRAKQTFLFLTSVLFLHVAADLHAPEVHTKLGALRGQYVSVKGKETGVHAYLGIPFAKPPVGPALRLSAPQPVEGWQGVRDATQQPAMCVQDKQLLIDLLDKLGGVLLAFPDISEDCLYLNIYIPAKKALSAKLPVMVWIHGGGFSMGSASMFDGSALAAYQDVVVVLIQYRLGVLGFLSTGDEHLSGNFGLLDQVQALRWIQQHIHNFGGNPDLVTIFGESAGGISVSLLLLSPLSDGLFHHAIAESGTSAMDILLTTDPLSVTKVLANGTGCSHESTEKIADCMRNLDLDIILATAQDDKLRFPLNIDGVFLTKPVSELYHTRELLTIPFMTGVTNDEAGYMLPDFFAPPNWMEGMDREHIMNVLYLFFPDPKDEIIRELLVDEYVGRGEDRVKNRDGFTKMLGDMLFTIPAIKTAKAHTDAGAPVYLYEYQHSPKFLLDRRPSFVGSDHGDELFSVFGWCFTTSHVTLAVPCTESDERLSRIMMSYWGNFARTGSPNGDGLVHWPQYGAEEYYLSIDVEEQVTGRHLKKDKFVFVTQTLPEKLREYKEKMERSEL
ncbi:liver carboxylesterase 2-like [Anarrhichthys ocellatus]|uniref:liver carboxylesterase 2-like n=1 Tax=Anarrhichthys ocellatus TaxID=433405 RepID=UPI0012ED9CEC|nr:liver carboxylesterase 2-like [Anarrhichthys ocellatus]